jgi:hypothetical protein
MGSGILGCHEGNEASRREAIQITPPQSTNSGNGQRGGEIVWIFGDGILSHVMRARDGRCEAGKTRKNRIGVLKLSRKIWPVKVRAQ